MAETKEDIIDVRLMTVTSDWDPEEQRICQQEDPDLKCMIHGLEMNKLPTREEIVKESPGVNAYWAQWNSLKLVSGCLHRVWEAKIQSSDDYPEGKNTRISQPAAQRISVGQSGYHLGKI